MIRKTLRELSSPAFIERKKNAVLMGPSGLGKTHLLPSLSKFFGKCGKIMTDDTVATANLSRLLHHAHIASGDSYRIKVGVVDFL